MSFPLHQENSDDLIVSDEIINLIPSFDFIDLNMAQQMDEHYNYIMQAEPESKKSLKEANIDFLRVHRWVVDNTSNIKNAREAQLSDTSLRKDIYENWNRLIVKLFAEEKLDDFSYREAISLGHYNHILATRKLLSPVKWLSLIVKGSYDFIDNVLYYLVITQNKKNLSSALSFYHQKERHLVDGLIIALKLLLSISIIAVPLVLLPYSVGSILNFIYVLPIFFDIFLYLANPFNEIIRPLAQNMGVDPFYIMLAVTPALIISPLLVRSFLASASATEAIILASNAVALLTLACQSISLKKIYDKSPIGGLIGLALAPMYVTLPTHGINKDTMGEAFSLLVTRLTNLNNYVFIKNILSVSEEGYINSDNYNPLPKEKTSTEIKEAVLKGAKKASLSHRFFNTGKDTEFQNPQEKQTNGHSSSFFGSQARNDVVVDSSSESYAMA